MPQYQRHHSNSYDLQQVQDRIAAFADRFGPVWFDGVMIENVELSANTTKLLAHGLRRPWKGCTPISVQARPCAFRAYQSTQQDVGSGAAETVTLDGEDYDDGNDFASNTFTAPLTARYRFDAVVGFSEIPADGTEIFLSIYDGTADYPTGWTIGGAHAPWYPGSWEVDLSEGATMVMRIYHDHGTPRMLSTGARNTWFSGRIVGSQTPAIDTLTTQTNEEKAKIIPVRAERPCTADLWVY